MLSVSWRRAGSAAVLALAAPLVLAQVGHPAKGSWSGFWGPDDEERNRILLLLDWENNEIVGTINPGRNGVEISRAELDPSTWTLTIEADMPAGDRGTKRFVMTGELQNLGSWTNRRYSGTYRLGDETGDFVATLN